MKKRLRKKLRLQEFQAKGFEVQVVLFGGLRSDVLDAYWHRLTGMVKANDLEMYGGPTHFLLCADSRRTATEADRKAVETWLLQQDEVLMVFVDPLVDPWQASWSGSYE
ncbi:DUF469 family protein [Hymenobacter sp. BT664]|uniref:DUF469 family protein n=1 Tax=Hymenobacter montanus TaxID=2771359 RepID=A0A927GJR2_9BACT|nr:50S ribosome-binding protein YggL [Hymenobacter montanus]MBD2768777.1 DUF469 family protein [Hymenobacter montanus]